MKKTALLVLLLCLPVLTLFAADRRPADRVAVERAVLDYVEAFYEVKPEYLERSVNEDLHKFGYWRQSPDDEYRRMPMSYEQLVDLAKRWNAEGKIPSDAPKKVELLDVLDKTASAKLTAHWGIDYMHLAKIDGKWKIVQVLYQSDPKD